MAMEEKKTETKASKKIPLESEQRNATIALLASIDASLKTIVAFLPPPTRATVIPGVTPPAEDRKA